MGKKVMVAKASALAPGSCKHIDVEGCSIALFHVEGKIHALDGTCIHRGGPLGEGSLEGTVVTCPWHGWSFDVRTGDSPVIPGAHQPTLPVHIEGEDVFVEIEGD